MTVLTNFSPIVNNATGKEELDPITEIEKNDGRPVPDDCRYVEIDCIPTHYVQLRGSYY